MIRRLCLSALVGLTPGLGLAMPSAAAPAPSDAAAPAAPASADPAGWAYLKVPLFSDAFSSVPAAAVEGEPITLGDLTDAVAGAHESRKDGAVKGDGAGKVDVMPVLDRLIDVRLIALEARNTGLDTLPEIENPLKEFRETTGQELLKQRVASEAKGDPAVVDRLYRESVKRWMVRSVLFPNESDAIKFKAAVVGGKGFEEAAKAVAAENKGKGGDAAQALTRTTALPGVVAVLERSKAGDLTAPLRLDEGWAVLKIEAVEYPEDPKALERAQGTARVEAQKAALTKYYEATSKRFATIDQKLLRTLDFEAKKPGMAALKKDPRVLAKIKGGKAITVGELASEIEGGFYHGINTGVKKGTVNRKKLEVFDGLLARRILPLEVKRLGIEETPEFARRVEAFRNGLLFSSFIGRVLAPKIQVTDEAIRKYYDEHKKDYSYPGFYKLESLAFTTAKEAQAAVDKLTSGTDFKWLNANSAQVPPAQRKAKLEGTLSESTLPKELAAALSGAKPGDHRLYADPSSQFYAVRVVDVVPPREQPFEEVQGKIREDLFFEALGASVKEWTGKLRKATDVKVFITRIGN